MKEARFYEKQDDVVICKLCPRNCKIAEGKRGACGVREVRNSKLYSLVYGKIAAINVDPIEKKPFFHFHPGSKTLSFGTVGCNFFCPFCCNWELSRSKEIEGIEISPEQAIELANRYWVDGLSFTYNEPTVFFEWASDVAKKKGNLYATFVTNGYTGEEAAKEATTFLDAAVVDFKTFNPDFYKKYILADIEPCIRTLKLYAKKIWVEVTLLYIPKHTDLQQVVELAELIASIRKSIPLHIIRFHPYYRFSNYPQTPVEELEKAREKAAEMLDYVYIGNVPGHEFENTYCHNCGKRLIKRFGFYVLENLVEDGKCPYCGAKIPGVW